MTKTTKAQRQSIKVLYDRSPYGAASYREFRKRLIPGWCGEVMLPWCGMWVGIERDGYRHT